jgi:DNA-binding NarL/FixJ family response regulator
MDVSEKTINIILADDHEVVRAGLRRLFSIEKTIKILADATNGEDAIELVKYHKPDVALIDILMPRMDGIEATRVIKKEFPNVFVLMLTAFEDHQHIDNALSAGADGYLSKGIGAKELIDAVHRVIKGERVFSKTILNLLQKKYTPYHENDNSSIVISKREQEILNMVVAGKTSPEIADKLFLSVRTVQTHRANIMKKLNVNNAAGLVRYAVMGMQDSADEEQTFDQKG